MALNQKKLPGCYLHRSALNDVARTENLTFVCTEEQQDAGLDDAVMLKDGRALLVYNDTPNSRTPLSVAVSRDGAQWTKVLDLETEPGEYSYPAVIQAQDGKVHFTYTWRRQKIRHAVVDLGKLTPRKE